MSGGCAEAKSDATEKWVERERVQRKMSGRDDRVVGNQSQHKWVLERYADRCTDRGRGRIVQRGRETDLRSNSR